MLPSTWLQCLRSGAYQGCLKNISEKMAGGGLLALGTPYCEDGGVPVQAEKGALHLEHIEH